MKIRNGFVSNSSSSSFCIYGSSFTGDQLKDILVENGILENDSNVFDYLDGSNLFTENGMSVKITPWDTIAIGRSWSSLKDEETAKEFKDGIEKELKKLSPDQKCSTIEASWYDG